MIPLANYESDGTRLIAAQTPPSRLRRVGTGAPAALDPAVWARERLHFHPDERQSWVLAARRRRLLLNCSRQWGKSTVTAVRAVYEAVVRPRSLTVIAAPTARQSAELVRKAADFMTRLDLKPRGDGQNRISLLFPNSSRIVGLPGTEATVRGFSAATLVVIDEAARVPDALYRALRPMLAVAGGDLWLLSTPCGRRGFFYDEWANPLAADWDRVSVPAVECPRIPAGFLDEERLKLGDQWFRQEYCCEFVDVEAAVFSRELLERALTDDIEPLQL